MKLENGYIGGKIKGVGGRAIGQKNYSMELSKPPRRDSDKNARVVGGSGGSDKKDGNKIGREEEKNGSAGGNVSQRYSPKSEVAEEELVDGWPKWLTDNIPKKALVGLIPKSAESYDKLDKVSGKTFDSSYFISKSSFVMFMVSNSHDHKKSPRKISNIHSKKNQ